MSQLYHSTVSLQTLCSVCGAGGSRRCGGCGAVSYCSPGCQKSDWARHKPLCCPVLIKETEGRGRGLVAARDIKTGDLLLQDTALITVTEDADTWQAGRQIHEQVSRLKEGDRREFYRLTRMQKLLDISDTFISAAGDDTDNIKKAELVSLYKHETAIFFNNDISGLAGSKSLYLSLALLNHSCSPNSCWSRAADHNKLELRALRTVKEGQEVTVNYISVEGRFTERDQRRERLEKGWDFVCRCELCESGEEEDTKLEIRSRQEEMRGLCDNALEDIDWSQLALLQLEVVRLVETLSSASLLLPRECQSLANLSHLARYNNLSNYRMETFTQFNHFYCREGNSSAATVTSRLPSLNLVIIFRKSDLLQLSLSTWRETVEARRARQAVTQYRQAEKLFSDWRLDREKKVKPSEKEVEQFLWLM